MSITEIKRGDRLDYPARDLKNGEVVRVGHATVWLVFTLAGGAAFPITASPDELRPHLNPSRVKVGEFLIRDVCDGKVFIESVLTGEVMQTEEARLETWLAKFWNKEF